MHRFLEKYPRRKRAGRQKEERQRSRLYPSRKLSIYGVDLMEYFDSMIQYAKGTTPVFATLARSLVVHSRQRRAYTWKGEVVVTASIRAKRSAT